MTTLTTANQLQGSITTCTINGRGTGQGFTVANGASWANVSTNFTSTNQKAILTIPHGKDEVVLNEDAALKVEGKLVLNGVNLEDRLKLIEEILHIPERDVKLEQKYPKLKKMYDEYIQNLKKYRTWETLKGEEK